MVDGSQFDLVVIDGPNLFNYALRTVIDAGFQRDVAGSYLTQWFDFDRLIRSSMLPGRDQPPRLGFVIFHSRKDLGSQKRVRLTGSEVTAFWARQAANPYSSSELIELPGMQVEGATAFCPNCKTPICCSQCGESASVEEKREKGVDTSITTFLLETADAWSSACIGSSDADFVPPVMSLKRRGKQIFSTTEEHSSSGALALVCTSTVVLNKFFLGQDIEIFEFLRNGGRIDSWLKTQAGTVKVRGYRESGHPESPLTIKFAVSAQTNQQEKASILRSAIDALGTWCDVSWDRLASQAPEGDDFSVFLRYSRSERHARFLHEGVQRHLGGGIGIKRPIWRKSDGDDLA